MVRRVAPLDKVEIPMRDSETSTSSRERGCSYFCHACVIV